MALNEVLDALRALAGKPVFAQAFSHLASGTELALRLDDRVEFAVFLGDGQVEVEERSARADVEFRFSAEALRQLGQHPGDNLSSFGIAVLEQLAARQMGVRIRGSLLRVLTTGGYLKLILAAGPDLLAYLAQFGLTNSRKIVDLMRSLKN